MHASATISSHATKKLLAISSLASRISSYILSSFVSIRITTAKQQKDKEDKKSKNIDGNTGKEIKEENNEMDAVMQTNKMMSWFVPIMSISIAFIAPLGLALYWLISNILMIAERLIIDKVVKS